MLREREFVKNFAEHFCDIVMPIGLGDKNITIVSCHSRIGGNLDSLPVKSLEG